MICHIICQCRVRNPRYRGKGNGISAEIQALIARRAPRTPRVGGGASRTVCHKI